MKVVFIISLIICLTTTGKVSAQNYSISFDGDGDYIEIPDADILSPSSFTIELWVKQPAVSGRNTYLQKTSSSSGSGVEYAVMENPPGADGGIYSYVESQFFASGSHATTNEWTHIAVTFNSGTDLMEVFVQGVSAGTAAMTTEMVNSDGKLFIGWVPGNPDYNALTGTIDELRISDNVRYASNFTVPSNEFTTSGNTVALYHFNEGCGSLVTDASGNGNHGTIYNATWSTDTAPLSGNSSSHVCEISWQLQIRAQTSHSNDNDNILGVSASAISGFDSDFDEVEPPLPAGNYLSVYFPHADWNNSLGDNFTKDIRDSIDIYDVMQVWDFEVKSSTSEQTTLTFLFTDIPSVPVILENRTTGERKVLGDNSTYTFTTVADSAHTFRISVGDTVAPQLTLGSSCSGARILQADSTFALDWTTSDGDGVDSVFVWFSADSGVTYSSVASLGTASTYNWQVPDYNLNHKCMMRIKAQDYAGNSVSKSSNHLFTIAGDSLEASISAGWSLWGAPITPKVDSMAVNLGDDFSDYWVTYAYADSGYTFADKLKATQGCWLGTLENATIDVVGTPLTANKTVDLPVGWDLVSNPLVLDVAVDSLQFKKDGTVKSKAEAVDAGWINTIYGYGSSGYSEASTIEPWKAYWISVLESGLSMTLPIHRQSSQSLGKTSTTDWQITFRANTENAKDNSAVIGIASEATDAFDNNIDVVKPPLPPDGASYTSLAILHPEWNHLLGDRFAVDFRGDIPLNDSKEWHLLVESSNTEVDLAWTIENLPPEIQLGIDLTGDGSFEDMRTISSVKVSAKSSITVRLLNTTTGIHDKGALLNEYAIQQNYPNPFNPTTEISFQLPRSDKVTLKIYNLLGQEIRTLADGQFTAGVHTVRWDGKDNSGNRASSGVFIYRIHTDSFSQIKKMLLVK